MKIKLLNKEHYIIYGYWVLVFLTQFVQVMPQSHSLLEALLYCTIMVVTIYPISNFLSGKLLIKAMKNKATNRFILQFVAFTILVGILFGANILLFTYLEQRGCFPISRYFSMDYVTPYMIIIAPISAGAIINISICGIRFLLEYIHSQKTLVEYQLKSLQHQFTPHFMFNVLNHIHVLMQTDIELASELLIQYSGVLRYQLYNNEHEITLSKEIQFLKDYIEVEKMRWQGKIVVNTTWDIKDEQLKIPPLLYVTFLENAFKHVDKSEKDLGEIDIALKQDSNTILLKVTNSQTTIKKRSLESSGLGLKNIQERLQILFYGRHELIINNKENSYSITLTIKL